jgi:uncharacterized OB-fold protein
VRTQIPAVAGWFDADPERPHLLGSRCAACGSYFFPKELVACRNPACQGRELAEVPLSRTGTLWSFTDNRYQPPAPYVSPDPFEPYGIAAVELAAEGMVVLGQLARGVELDALEVGMPMELVTEILYSDDAQDYVVWKWKPAARRAG